MNKLIKVLIVIFLINIATIQAKNSSYKVSFYSDTFEGRLTSNGEIFSNSKLTCASNSHKMGTKLKVTNIRNGKFIYVRVNDTGILHGRKLDLSKKAFSSIGELSKGIIRVRIQKIKPLDYKLHYNLNFKYYVRTW